MRIRRELEKVRVLVLQFLEMHGARPRLQTQAFDDVIENATIILFPFAFRCPGVGSNFGALWLDAFVKIIRQLLEYEPTGPHAQPKKIEQVFAHDKAFAIETWQRHDNRRTIVDPIV